MHPRFSVVIPVQDRADTIGRAVAGVLAQTFADLELIVVDDLSDDETLAATRAVSDARVRILCGEGQGFMAGCRIGLAAARGRWAAVIDPDTVVSAAWLARIGRLADSTGAAFVTCGGEQRHLDGSLTEILPQTILGSGRAAVCVRPGAFVTDRTRLVDATDRLAHEDGGQDRASGPDLALEALSHVLADGLRAVRTPERLVAWTDRAPDSSPSGDELRLQWAFQALDALAGTPIPDGETLARYATMGGVAASRLRRPRDARLLFRIACRAHPEVRKHWARLAVCHVPPLSRRIWESSAATVVTGSGGPDDLIAPLTAAG